MNKGYCVLFIKMLILSSLTFSCQGVNDNKIDPILLTHAKSIIDFDSLNSPYLQVVQFDFKTAWLYTLSSFDGGIWFYTGKGGINNDFKLPTDLIKYKGKYILFYLKNKKSLNENLLAKAMNLKRDKDGVFVISYPEHVDERQWLYFKDKYSNKSVYALFRLDDGVNPLDDSPKFRYFLCNEQDSAVHYSHIIDMRMQGMNIYGTESESGKYSNLNQIKFGVEILNKTDSSLYISTLPEKYGHFVVRNGKNTLSCHVVDTTNVNEVSSGMYEIAPHTNSVLYLSTEKTPIKFGNTPPKKYPDKIYQLVHDSIYYIPTHTPSENDKRYIWNKRFKICLSYLSYYKYYIDGTEYMVYYDGEIDERGKNIKK